jgi:hypothetical protein
MQEVHKKLGKRIAELRKKPRLFPGSVCPRAWIQQELKKA